MNGKEVRLAGIDSAERGTYSGTGVYNCANERAGPRQDGHCIFETHTPRWKCIVGAMGAVYLGNGDEEELYRRDDWKDIFINYIMVYECLSSPNNKGRNMYIDHDEIKAAYEKCKIAELPTLVRVEFKVNLLTP